LLDFIAEVYAESPDDLNLKVCQVRGVVQLLRLEAEADEMWSFVVSNQEDERQRDDSTLRNHRLEAETEIRDDHAGRLVGGQMMRGLSRGINYDWIEFYNNRQSRITNVILREQILFIMSIPAPKGTQKNMHHGGLWETPPSAASPSRMGERALWRLL
jgi:hypothetical protein